MTQPEPIPWENLLARDPALRASPASASNLVARAAAVAARCLDPNSPPLLVVVPEAREAEELSEALRGFLEDAPLLLEPWDILPFEPSSLEPPAAAARVEALAFLAGADFAARRDRRPRACIASARSLSRLTLTGATWKSLSYRLSYADEIAPAELRKRLVEAGYSPVAEVALPGEFSARGGLLDFFSPGNPWPVRVAWDGDLVESLRYFDGESQRTIEPVESVVVLPPRELCLPPDPAARDAVAAEIGRDVRSSLRRDHYVEAVREGALPEGIEVLLPFLVPVVPVFELGPCRVLFVDRDACGANVRETWEEAEREARESDLGYAPERLWMRELPEIGEAETLLTLPAEGVPSVTTEPPPPAPWDARVLRTDLRRLVEQGDRVVMLTALAARVKELIREEKLPPESLTVLDGTLVAGARLPLCGLAVLGDADLFGHRRRRTRGGRARRAIADWGALKPGDYVAHVHHGVGIFRGIERIRTMGETRDVVLIEYAGGDKLYLPPHETDFVERYTVLEGQQPRLDRLGANHWAKVREKAERETAEIARELLDLYALRHAAQGVPYPPPDDEELFARSFGYEETPDQEESIAALLSDIAPREKREPMDRLLCGDVGFGKTEVALRAVFRVARAGRQVAVLCPTTILALQHAETFAERLRPFGIATAALSRFQDARRTKKVIEDLASGALPVVIGTHRLLSSTVRFRDLGLVVVDEEQRFGVRHKEKLKNLRRQVDVLTMTATPIPRTLHLALSGARSVSLIETPPPGRAPVQTIVEPFNEEHVRRAIRRELDRDGQVFYVHNRIETIDRVHQFLRRLFPRVPMAVAHGQMKEDELSSTMLDFMSGRTAILLSTSIIENGLDIPRANTLIVDQAERFGLAQLYQLRGRVGRSKVKAYAYFFHSADGTMTKDGRARLAAIAEHTALGSGYAIARRDMEIRGAGEILGVSQHGEMESIGYDMYCRLLREAMAELKGEGLSKRRARPVLELSLPAYIPFEWLGGEELVSAIHREIAAAETVEAVEKLRESLVDRFGIPPAPVENLLTLARLRAYAALDGVASLTETETGFRARWHRTPKNLGPWLDALPDPLVARSEADILVIEGVPPGRSRLEFVRKMLRR